MLFWRGVTVRLPSQLGKGKLTANRVTCAVTAQPFHLAYNVRPMARGRRTTLSKGIYRDRSGFEVRATVNGTAYTARLPLDSTLAELKAKRAELDAIGRTETPRAARGTLRADTPGYLRLVAHLASAKDIAGHLTAWNARLGDVPRHRLTLRDVLDVRARWLADGLTPKTVNNRCQTLRNLYRRLDGRRAATPCDDLDPLPVPKTPIRRVPDALIVTVEQNLRAGEQRGTLKDAKTRARFRVFVSTGKRPCEIMRAVPGDVDLDARVWVPRDAKGGFCPGVYLNADMLAAWELFIEADAWGPYNHGNFGRVIRTAGWPADVAPYQARHNAWISASERGIDLADIAVGAGHRDPRMTRAKYVPVLNSRLQAMSERMDGRFGGFSVAPKRGTARKSKRNQD